MFAWDDSTALRWLWVVWLLQAAWCCYNVWTFRARTRRLARRQQRFVEAGESFTPPAAVIMPIKGADPDLLHHVAQLRRQNYGDYRVIFVVESETDPAYPVLQHARATDTTGAPMEIVVAGPAQRGGQKVHNLLAAARLLDREHLVAFADADAVAHPDWLMYLAKPLRREEIGATTGYRWLVPADGAPTLPSALASVINSSVATLMGRPWRNFAWGGSMAMRVAVLRESKLLELWDGALSDDYQFTRAVKATGRVVRFVPRCLVASPARFTWASLLEFGRRQYLITRIYAPAIWLMALVFLSIYLAGWISVIAAAALQLPGWGWGVAAAAAVCLLDVIRGTIRGRTARQMLGDAPAAKLRLPRRLDQLATPLWMTLHLLLVIASAFGRTITWARIRYRLRGRQNVEILSRS